MRNSKMRHIIGAVCFFSVLLAIFAACNYLLASETTYTRVMLHEMYAEEEPVDMVFLGGSITYEHFDPGIWSQTLGMNTFNLGSSAQTPDASYYLMKEFLKTQKPEYCIFGLSTVSFMNLPEYNNPTKDFILFDYMKPSFNKLLYGTHVFEKDAVYSALFPFLRNKAYLSAALIQDNIDKKTSTDYRSYSHTAYNTASRTYMGRGFVYVNSMKTEGAVGMLTPFLFTSDTVDDMKVNYFQKLVKLCRSNGCELILVAPPIPYANMALQENYQDVCDFYKQLAADNEVELFDFSLCKPHLLILSDDTFYDAVHMGGEGAEKFSKAASNLVGRYINRDAINDYSLFYSSYQELLDASPYIFNAWISCEDDVYYGNCTNGNNVTPEYQFSYRTTEDGEWEVLQKYSLHASIRAESMPENAVELRLCVRPCGSSAEYQQLDVYKMN